MNLLIFLSLLALISADSFTCPGITYTITESNFTLYYLEAFKDAKQKINSTKPTNAGHVILGWLKVQFNLTEIKLTTPELAEKVKSVDVKDKEIKLTSDGPLFSGKFTMKYSFSVLGVNLFYGTASVDVKTESNNIVQKFIDDKIKSTVESKLTLKIDKISGVDFLGWVSYWIKEIAEKGSLVFPLRLIEQAIDDKILHFYSRWIDTQPFVREDLQMVFHNELVSLHKISEFVHFCMRTKIGIKDRPYNKTVYHHESVPELTNSTIKGRTCIPVGLLAGILDTYGKARDKMFSIKAEDLNITNRTDSLMQAIPRLRDGYKTAVGLEIGCRSNSLLTIMLVNHNNTYQMQIPIVCDFAEVDGDTLVTMEFVARSGFDFEFAPDNKGNLTANVILRNPTLYSTFKYPENKKPVEDQMSLQRLATKVIDLFNGMKLYKEGIKVELYPDKPAEEGIKDGKQVCFIYTA
jgi:hypothetical protein